MQKQNSGSRFVVLEVETVNESIPREKEVAQEVGIKEGKLEKGRMEALPKQYKMKGDSRNMGEVGKRQEKPRARGAGLKLNEGGETKEEQACYTLLAKNGNNSVLRENQSVKGSMDGVSECNPDLSSWKGVEMVDKENLDPGEVYRMRDGNGGLLSEEGRAVNVFEEPTEHPNRWSKGGDTPTRGAASKGFAAVLRDMKFRYRLDVVVILEPRINDLAVDVLSMEEQFIHCRMSLGGKKTLLTAVYASPNEQKRHRAWELMQNIANEVTEPWLLAGNFNEIRSPLEQEGGGHVSEARCRKFNDWIQDCELVDLEAKGPFFTWNGPKWEGLERVFKRLDRCLCNVIWQEVFMNAEVRVVPRVGSDHHPLVVNLNVEFTGQRVKPFRYEIAWQMHEEFDDFIKGCWKNREDVHMLSYPSHLQGQLSDLQLQLKQWHKEVFGNIENRKRRVLNRLNGIQKNIGRRYNPFLSNLENELEDELLNILR
ncbi:hypothetical protein K1719_023121 [Acacia pycnantha]|nr:hypothetical protein K1719_023121 [Acacia pycnantha]